MRRYPSVISDPKDETIKRLNDELMMLRYELISVAPQEAGLLLGSYYKCKSRSEIHHWLNDIAEQISAMAKPLPKYQNSVWGERGNCPLCGSGGNSFNDEGFALPEGLRRHLVGFGNAHHCVITKAARDLARQYGHDQFAALEEQERLDKLDELASRRKIETVYQTSPLNEPLLMSEHIWSSENVRNPDQLIWAEDRLLDLGFQKQINGNIEAWTDEHEKWVVYADHRQVGRINFTAWKKPLPKRTPSNTYKYRLNYFHLLDSWKKNLKEKYEKRLPEN